MRKICNALVACLMATVVAVGMVACSSDDNEQSSKQNTVRLNIAGEKVELHDVKMVAIDEQGDTISNSKVLIELLLPKVDRVEGVVTTDEGDTAYYHSLQEMIQTIKQLTNDTTKTIKQ